MKRQTTKPKGFDPARRAALLKLGRFAVYTAPVMSTLLISERAVATHQSGPGDICSNPSPNHVLKHCTPTDPCTSNPTLPECGSTGGAAASQFSGEDFSQDAGSSNPSDSGASDWNSSD